MRDYEKQGEFIRARERVLALRKFYTGLATYMIINIFLAGVNYYTNEFRNPWVLWVVGFWGLGILMQAMRLFGKNLLFGKDWEERKIKELLDEEQRRGRNQRNWE